MGSLVSEETGSNGSKVSSQKNNEIVPMKLDRTEVKKFYGNIKKGKQVVRNTKKKEYRQKGKKKEKLLWVKGKISKKDALILIDSGAFKNFINVQFVETHQLMINKSIKEKSMIELADGTPCKSCGHMLNDQKVFNINGNANRKLIGSATAMISKNQLVKKAKQNAELFAVLTINTQNATDDKRIDIPEFLKEVVDEYQDVFPKELPNNLLPKRSVDHEITLQE
ncbi:1378_t:CDS:2, partial [Cetraspora pellucida]